MEGAKHAQQLQHLGQQSNPNPALQAAGQRGDALRAQTGYSFAVQRGTQPPPPP